MPGRTIIPQQPAKPNGLADWRKWLGWLCFAACWLVADCLALLVACPIRSRPACGASTSCGICTSEMFSCRFAFVLTRYLWEEFSSIPHLIFESVCSTCLFGSFACQMIVVGLGCCFVLADSDSDFVDLVLSVFVLAC